MFSLLFTFVYFHHIYFCLVHLFLAVLNPLMTNQLQSLVLLSADNLWAKAVISFSLASDSQSESFIFHPLPPDIL